MKTVSKTEFEAFVAARSTRIETERDVEYSYETYFDKATDEEIAFISYHSSEQTTYHIAK
jgi:hypothetical protein